MPDYKYNPDIFAIEDIGEVFNFRYWLRWEEEPDNDYEYGRLSVKKPTAEDEKIFKDTLLGILPDYLDMVREEEILLSNSSSSCLVDGPNALPSKVFKEKERNNHFSSSHERGTRTTVYKCPTEVRDCVTLSVPQSNTVKLIERQTALLCRDLPFSMYGLSNSEFEEEYAKFKRKFTWFFDRDIKKSGITHPRFLPQWILEVLGERFPEHPAYLPDRRKFYSQFELIIDGKSEFMKRGHGLGMGGALFTVAQIVIFLIIKDTIEDSEFISEEYGAIFYHDDCSVGFKSEDDLEAYINYEDEVLERYQIIRNLKKSHRGSSFVFCEIYSDDKLNEKKSYYLTEIFNAFSAYNIVHAKALVNNLSRRVPPDLLEGYLEDLWTKFGYEFFPNEKANPYLFGGWIKPSFVGIDMTFHYSPEDIESWRAFDAVTSFPTIKLRKDKGERIYNDPITQIFGDIDIPDATNLNYKQEWRTVKAAFTQVSHLGWSPLLWDSLKGLRLKAFLNSRVSPMIKKELAHNYVVRHPQTDFYPAPFDRVWHKIDLLQAPLKSKWRPANPLLSYIKFYNPYGRVDKHVVPDPRWAFGKMEDRGLSAEERRQALRYISIARGNPVHVGEFYDLQGFKFEPRWYNFYNNPGGVASAALSIMNKKGMPVWGGLSNKYNIREDQIDFYNDIRVSPYVGMFTFNFVRDVIKFNLEIGEMAVEIAADVLAEKAAKAPPVVVKEKPPDEEYHIWGPDEYWAWSYAPTPPRPDNGIVRIFNEISCAIFEESTMRAGQASIMPVFEPTPLSPLARAVWILNGGQVNPDGFLVLRPDPGGGPDFWDSDEGSNNGIGLFGEDTGPW